VARSGFALDQRRTPATPEAIANWSLTSLLRFERALGFRAESWMRMQLAVDLYDAMHGRAGKAVGRIKPIARAS
jgi:plasmid maintenance system antidote protein VapI